MNLPWIESPFFNRLLKEKSLSDKDEAIVRNYEENGFVVLTNLIDQKVIDALVLDVKEKGFNPDFPIPEGRDHNRVQDLWKYSQSSKTVACHPEILRILELFYEREPIPFQTLNFLKGSEQMGHSDSIHFSSMPERFMCGVWVALEDIDEDNGPLFYYPKSHKLPQYNFSHLNASLRDTSYEKDYKNYERFIEDLMLELGFEKKRFLAKKGDVLIWSSNIIHGGCQQENSERSRLSQVTHYFFKDCIYFTPMGTNFITGEYYLRTHLTDIKTGKEVMHRFNQDEVHFARVRNNNYRIEHYFKSYHKFISGLYIFFHQLIKKRK